MRRSELSPTLFRPTCRTTSSWSTLPSRRSPWIINLSALMLISRLSPRFPNPFSKVPVFSTPAKASVTQANLTSDAVPASCANTITPACLQALYNIPTTRATQSSNVLAVSGFIEQFANQADLRVCHFLIPPVRYPLILNFPIRYSNSSRPHVPISALLPPSLSKPLMAARTHKPGAKLVLKLYVFSISTSMT